MRPFVCAFVLVLVASTAASAASYYSGRPDDPRAVELTRDRFDARGDGIADDTAALQRAIDAVQESTGEGILLVPAGRYRITQTLHVWPGIRIIGYGRTRPVLVLAPHTAGFDNPQTPRYMMFFAGSRPKDPATPPPDANPGTFYSAVSNIDFEVQDGNPGAVAVRSRYAQHSFTSHVEFRIGSGLAGIHEAGNVAEDVRFVGGEYGVWTGMPSPSWQFTIVDGEFEGQRRAAIREQMAGLTLVRPRFSRVPTAVEIEAGRPDNVWIKDGRFEDVSGPALVVSQEHAARTQINASGVVCRGVPEFVRFRESGRSIKGPSAAYRINEFSHGVTMRDVTSTPEVAETFDADPIDRLPEPVPTDLAPMPPVAEWVSVQSLGARGDGTTDDTAAFRRAIETHRVVYVPTGKYIITDTLTLRPDTVLVGLHPSATQLVVPDRTPAFDGIGSPVPLIETPKGGTNLVIGIGLYTNAINPRAVAARWMAGARSTMNDVRMLGGHGTTGLDGKRQNPYNTNRTGDPDPQRRWDSQYPSLWITNGGGGTFFDIWTPSSFAQAGLLVSDTTTSGRVYQLSSEHHVRYEVLLRNVANWELYALQTEEERGESGFASALEIDRSSNITIANMHLYRVISSAQPFPYAIRVAGSRQIRFRNIHCYSNSKVSFDAAVFDQDRGVQMRQREFASLTIDQPGAGRPGDETHVVVAPGAEVEKLADGFHNISGGAVDPSGNFYFVDAKWQRIYRWTVSDRTARVVADAPLEPVNLAFDRAGHLLVVSYAGKGTVYVLDPDGGEAPVSTIAPVAASARPNATAVLPVGDWMLNADPQTNTYPARTQQYVSPDGTTYIAATQGFVEGATSWGVKSADVIRAFGLTPATPGSRTYLTDESQAMTWSALVGADGNLSDWKVFAYQGGEGVATDRAGNVYIAAGEVYVYNPSGVLIDRIHVPERPLQVVFGGPDRRTLFMPARHGLYAVQVRTDAETK